MEEENWRFYLSTSARNYRSLPTPMHQSGYRNELEDVEGDDDDNEIAVDYPCPFCSEDYDLVELCHHIDEEHHLEANHGICPVCAKRVKMNMVDHINAYHKHMLKSEKKQRLYKDESYSPLYPPITSKHLQPLDPLLSFISNLRLLHEPKSVQPDSANSEKKSFPKDLSQKDRKSPSAFSDTQQLEKAKKCVFVQELLSSTIIDDGDY